MHEIPGGDRAPRVAGRRASNASTEPSSMFATTSSTSGTGPEDVRRRTSTATPFRRAVAEAASTAPGSLSTATTGRTRAAPRRRRARPTRSRHRAGCPRSSLGKQLDARARGRVRPGAERAPGSTTTAGTPRAGSPTAARSRARRRRPGGGTRASGPPSRPGPARRLDLAERRAARAPRPRRRRRRRARARSPLDLLEAGRRERQSRARAISASLVGDADGDAAQVGALSATRSSGDGRTLRPRRPSARRPRAPPAAEVLEQETLLVGQPRRHRDVEPT